MPWQHPGDHFGRGPVEISLISAVRTHALCVHTQDCLGGRHRGAGRRGTAAHRPRLAAHALHTHAYAGLIRLREKHPRNSHLRRAPKRETAGQAPAPLREMRALPAVLVAGVHDHRATIGLQTRRNRWSRRRAYALHRALPCSIGTVVLREPPRNAARQALRALQILAQRSADELGHRDALGLCPPSDFVAKLGF